MPDSGENSDHENITSAVGRPSIAISQEEQVKKRPLCLSAFG